MDPVVVFLAGVVGAAVGVPLVRWGGFHDRSQEDRVVRSAVWLGALLFFPACWLAGRALGSGAAIVLVALAIGGLLLGVVSAGRMGVEVALNATVPVVLLVVLIIIAAQLW